MFRKLRNRKTIKKIWIGLAIIIIPAFFLWGFGAALRGQDEPSPFAGRIRGRRISRQDFAKSYRAVINRLLMQIGREQLAQLQEYLDLEAQAWDRIVLLDEARRRRITTGNAEVIDFIKEIPFFKSQGRFDPEFYREIITYEFRINPRDFEEEVRDNLTLGKLYEKVISDIILSEEEIKEAFNKENEQIQLNYISARGDDFLEAARVEQEQVLEYYNQDPTRFKKPLSYNLEYIKVAAEDAQTIAKISQSLDSGKSLQAAAKEAELEVTLSGFFQINEPIPHIGWSTEILRILDRLSPQQAAWPRPIQVDPEFVYFVGLKERKPPRIPAFDEIKDEIIRELKREIAAQAAREKLTACASQAKTIGLSEAAEIFGLEYGSSELFGRASYVRGLGDSERFFAASAGLEVNDFSKIISTPERFYIVELVKRVLPQEEEFIQEKERFAEIMQQELREASFQEFLNELKNKPNTYRY